MRFIKITLTIIVFITLTTLTQVGGIAYLFSISTFKSINKFILNSTLRLTSKIASFLFIYCTISFLVVPEIAKQFGRVPLPFKETNHIQPLNILTVLLNRNYVKKELRETTFEVARKMNKKYPGTTINYLDANFPFIDKFPLFPHLSHNDGKKLDLSFCYIVRNTNQLTNNCPSWIGYGICEEPLSNELNTAPLCAKKGNWQYSLLKNIVPQSQKNNFLFDKKRTRDLVNFFGEESSIKKIFIEPHLKSRLNLSSNKIKFHGCQAVRHDDHIHIQL